MSGTSYVGVGAQTSGEEYQIPSSLKLPDKYWQVEYLESDGNQYINMGFYPYKNDTQLSVKFMCYDVDTRSEIAGTQNASNGYFSLFTNGGDYYAAMGTRSAVRLDTAQANVVTTGMLSAPAKSYTISTSDGQTSTTNSSFAKINSKEVPLSSYNEALTTKNIFLFCLNKNGTASNFFRGRIYYVSGGGDISQTNVLLVPCIWKSMNKPGMYDLMNGDFYVNAGSGEFTCGPIILPESTSFKVDSIYFGKTSIAGFPEQGYQQVEYLETDGDAYIMTTHQPSESTRTIAKFGNMDVTKSVNLFGAYQDTESQSWMQWNNGFVSTFGKNYDVLPSTFSPDTENFLVDKNAGIAKITVNGITQTITQTGTFTKPEVFGTIFGINAASIEKNANIPSGYTQVHYIEGTGEQYINTGYYITSTTRMTVDFQFTSTTVSETAYVFGGYKTSRFGLGANTSGYMTFGMGNGYGRVTNDTNIHTAIFNSATHTVSFDGANRTAHSGTYSSHSGSNEWLGILGGLANDGNIKGASVRMFHLTIQSNGIDSDIIHDYYPVVRNSDGMAGVYDVIDGVFYGNDGTGYIIAGPSIDVWKASDGLRLYSYKTYNGDGTLARHYVPCYRTTDNKPGLYEIVHGSFYINANTAGEFTCGKNVSENVGVGVATRILKGYVGDANNIARLIYRYRTYLFQNGVDNTALTGGWTGSFTHKTNSGTNYSMTRMTNDGEYLKGSFSSSDGSSEKALYVRSVNAIDFSGYKKLCCLMEWYTSRESSAVDDNEFGVFDSAYTTCQTNQVATRFLAYRTHTTPKNSEYAAVTLEVDLTNVTKTGFVLYDNHQSNMNASINVRIKEIWLE